MYKNERFCRMLADWYRELLRNHGRKTARELTRAIRLRAVANARKYGRNELWAIDLIPGYEYVRASRKAALARYQQEYAA